MKDHRLPCTDIIIHDKFIFKNDVGQNRNNLYTIINSLCDKNYVNIVIFTVKDHSQQEYNRIKDEIVQSICDGMTPAEPPSVTIIATSKVNIEKHGRFIITNYLRYVSDDSLNYFLESGNYDSKSMFFQKHSLALRSNYDETLG